MSQRGLNDLLRWSIENSDRESLQHAAADRQAGTSNPAPLDPGIIDAILGKSDAQRMKECVAALDQLAVVPDDSTGDKDDNDKTKEAREDIWSELEMLVESLDNANDLEKLGLWDSLLKWMKFDKSQDDIMFACSVAGTAVQNNFPSQAEFLKHDPIPTLFNIISSPSTYSIQTRSKALFCLSSTIRHNPAALALFEKLDGWSVIAPILQDSENTNRSLQSKASYLIYSLISSSTPMVAKPPRPVPLDDQHEAGAEDNNIEHPAFNSPMVSDIDTSSTIPIIEPLRKSSVLNTIINSLSQTPDEPDETIRENYTRTLASLIQYSSSNPPFPSIFDFSLKPLTPNERQNIRIALTTERDRLANAPNYDHDSNHNPAEFSLTPQEWESVLNLI